MGCFHFFKILFIFRERVRDREREGGKHRSVASYMPPTGELAHSPGLCPDRELNLRWLIARIWKQLGSVFGLLHPAAVPMHLLFRPFFGGSSRGFFYVAPCHLRTDDDFTSFPIQIVFASCSLLIALARRQRVGVLVPAGRVRGGPSLRGGSFSFSLLNLM